MVSTPIRTTAAKARPTAEPAARGTLLQRKCGCGGTPGVTGACEECRKKRLLGTQRKPVMDMPGDRWEREADRVANAVMAGSPAAKSFGMAKLPAITPVRAAALQRDSFSVAAELPSPRESAAGVHPITCLHGSGQPLDASSRQFFEARFGRDLSDVRVHNGRRATELAAAVGARAYTTGRHIVFGAGEFAPNTLAGRRLIAHELVHTLQQDSNPGGPDAVLQRAPKEQCGARFLFEFDAEINDKPLVRGVPRVYYLPYPTKTDPAGKRIEPLVANTKLPAGQRSSDGYWRAVCHQPPGAPPQILWVLDEYVSKVVRPKKKRRPQERKRKEKEEPETAAPEGKNFLEDCTPDQASGIRKAISVALADLEGAIGALSSRPLSEHAQHALFLAFRTSEETAADAVVSKLRAIRAGLPTVGIQCEQGQDFYFCTKETVAYTRMISGVVHLCMTNWDARDPVTGHPRVLIHEGAHAFAGAPGVDDPYFDLKCNETERTSRHSSKYRRGKADPLACVVYHLRHRTAESAKSQKDLYSGESLKLIVQEKPTGPISLGGAPRRPSFSLVRAPVTGGFTYRWRLYDEADRHYLLRGEENDEPLEWLSFTNQNKAIIGRKTRDLLAKRGVTKGTIKCTIRLPDGTEKTLSLDLEFAP